MDEQPLSPEVQEISPFQLAMLSIQAYQTEIQNSMITQGGTAPDFDALPVYLSLKTLIVELTALRETFLDAACVKEDGTQDNELRMRLSSGYCFKVAQVCRREIQKLQQAPRIIKPS